MHQDIAMSKMILTQWSTRHCYTGELGELDELDELEGMKETAATLVKEGRTMEMERITQVR